MGGDFAERGDAFAQSQQSKDFSGKFMVRVAPELHERLVLKAMASGESLNSLVAKKLAKA
jgi:predicted HicB family RNase H-like nuclease